MLFFCSSLSFTGSVEHPWKEWGHSQIIDIKTTTKHPPDRPNTAAQHNEERAQEWSEEEVGREERVDEGGKGKWGQVGMAGCMQVIKRQG